MKKQQPKYKFYATLLDAYQGFIGSDKIYNEYWGFSENPQYTIEEFHEVQRQSFIDRINRVPFDSEKADRGTAFNEIVDCLILNEKSEKMQISSDKEKGIITAIYNEREFSFPIDVCREFSNYFKDAVPQLKVEAILPMTNYDVLLYGYLDELMPLSVHDIKTTSRYQAPKFKDHWQHIVYPFCLNQAGIDISDFEYNILLIKESKAGTFYESFTEAYTFVPDRDTPRLYSHIEGLVEFIETHKDLITDKKIFGYE